MKSIKRIIAVLMTFLMLVSAVPANVFAVVDESNPIALPKTEYAVGEAVIPEVYPQDESSYSWIGLYAKDDPTDGTVKCLWWEWTCYVDENEDFSNSQSKNGVGNDRADFNTYVSDGQLKAGNYKLVYYSNDNYDVYVVSGIVCFSVVGESGETDEDSTEIVTYCVGAPVVHTPSVANINWIGLYKASVTPGAGNSIAWAYPGIIDGKDIACWDVWRAVDDNSYADIIDDMCFAYQSTDGTWHLLPGKYKLIYFGDYSYDNHLETFYFEVVDEHEFSIEGVEKASFEKDGSVYNECTDCGVRKVISTISKATAFLDEVSFVENGEEHKPVVTIRDGNGKEISTDDYAVAYANNVEAGTATVTVTLSNYYYNGSIVLEFKISEPAHVCEYTETKITKATFAADGKIEKVCECGAVNPEAEVVTIPAISATLEYASVAFDGTEMTPVVTVASGETILVEGEDYEVVYRNNDKPGVATATVTLKGDYYEDATELNFNIKAMSVKKATYCVGEEILVTAYQSVSESDWVAITSRGTSPEQYLYYYYVTYELSGVPFVIQDGMKGYGHSLSYIPAGLYTIYFCKDDSYNVVESIDIVIVNHDYSIPVEGTLGTCTEPGLADGFMCSNCGDIKQDVIPASHAEEVIPGESATCTEPGLTEGKKCSVCGVVTVEQTVIPANGHKEVDIKGYEATCTEPGLTEGKKCSVCGDVTVEQTVIPANGHKEVDIKGYEATCIESGLTDGKKCTICQTMTVEQTVIPTSGHTEEVVSGKEATCTENGLTEGKKCSVCGTVIVEQEIIPKNNHSYNGVITESTCSAQGYTTYTCSACGDTYTSDFVGTLTHSYSATITRPSTHLSVGVKTYTCSACGDVYTENIPRTEKHTYYFSHIVESGCENKGYTVYICECGDSYNDSVVPETGHNYVDNICVNCGESKSDNCSCNCHKGGFNAIIWKIIRFFYKLFGINKICSCGAVHY